jgi:signal transduction histidine kinase
VLYGLVAIGDDGDCDGAGFRIAASKGRTSPSARWQAETLQRERLKTVASKPEMESLETTEYQHDFNNLLTVIVGNVSMAERCVTDPDGKRQLQSALKAGDSAVALTQRLLAFARKQVLQPQSVDLRRLVDGMQGLLLRTLRNCDWLSSDSALWPTLVDRTRWNSSSSIWRSMRRDARWWNFVHYCIEPGIRADALPELAPGQYVVLKVSDTGTGMDAATLARATEPFFTTKVRGRGGLGLAMMQGVVAQLWRHTAAEHQGQDRRQVGCSTRLLSVTSSATIGYVLPRTGDDPCV